MKVKWFFYGMIAILLFGCAFLVVYKRGAQTETYTNATVIVNGKVLANRNAKVFGDHVELPLIDILSSIGYSVRWLDSTTAMLSDGEKKLKLDLDNLQLIDLSDNENILVFPVGTMYLCCYSVNNNLILDDVTLRTLLFRMGIKADTNIDTKSAVISINTSDVCAN